MDQCPFTIDRIARPDHHAPGARSARSKAPFKSGAGFEVACEVLTDRGHRRATGCIGNGPLQGVADLPGTALASRDRDGGRVGHQHIHRTEVRQVSDFLFDLLTQPSRERAVAEFGAHIENDPLIAGLPCRVLQILRGSLRSGPGCR